jgi:chaperonin cofactor prefoldin
MLREINVDDFEDPNDNRGVYCRFYLVPREDRAASAEQGRPIFKDKEYLEIFCAGNENNIIRRPASDMDKRRFSKEYALFKSGDEEQLVGTPLSEVAWIPRTRIEELSYMKIRTVEALADLDDSACSRAPGLYELKRKAGFWLKKSEDAAPFTELAKENEEMAKRIAVLEKSLEASNSQAAKSKAKA